MRRGQLADQKARDKEINRQGRSLQGVDSKNGNNDSVVSAEVSSVVGDSLESCRKEGGTRGEDLVQALLRLGRFHTSSH